MFFFLHLLIRRTLSLKRDMTTYRDAVRRLTIVYNECHPDSKDKRDTDKELDGFTRLKKTIHLDVKATRQVCTFP